MRAGTGCVFAAALTIVAMPAIAATDHATAPGAATPPHAAPALPSRVGRVSLVSGDVGFRGPGEPSWSDAAINDPVSAGAAVRTDVQARAEMRIGADTIDLAQRTEAAVAGLDDRAIKMVLDHGRIDLDVPRLGAGESIEIDFPRGAVRLLAPGRYDVDTGNADERPRIAAYTGGARFSGGGADVPVKAGDALVLSGPGAARTETEPATADEFAQWCGSRAVDEQTLAAPYFVADAMTGFAALDAAGAWRSDPKFGEVWVPTDPPGGWAPFRFGHWRWVAPWGWTWIDDQPWGFATSHYGRWAFADGQWVWAPGKLQAHPSYAPAVVAFLGTPGVGLSYPDSFGPAIAWFPLAPGEVYWPSDTSDLDTIRDLNRGQIADLDMIRMRADGEPPAEIANGHFANRQFASVVPRPVFVAGDAVLPALVHLPLRRLQNAPAIMGSPRIGPPPPPAPPARIAAALAVRPRPPPAQGAALAARRSAWARTVHAAVIRARNYHRALLLRAAHLRAPVYASARLRHTIVLRVAGAWRVLHPVKRRKKELRR